jgi:hypothetical protein
MCGGSVIPPHEFAHIQKQDVWGTRLSITHSSQKMACMGHPGVRLQVPQFQGSSQHIHRIELS